MKHFLRFYKTLLNLIFFIFSSLLILSSSLFPFSSSLTHTSPFPHLFCNLACFAWFLSFSPQGNQIPKLHQRASLLPSSVPPSPTSPLPYTHTHTSLTTAAVEIVACHGMCQPFMCSLAPLSLIITPNAADKQPEVSSQLMTDWLRPRTHEYKCVWKCCLHVEHFQSVLTFFLFSGNFGFHTETPRRSNCYLSQRTLSHHLPSVAQTHSKSSSGRVSEDV